MAVDPIFRVRRLALAAILTAGGEPRPDQYRRAALEPFDEGRFFTCESQRHLAMRTATSATLAGRPPGPQF